MREKMYIQPQLPGLEDPKPSHWPRVGAVVGRLALAGLALYGVRSCAIHVAEQAEEAQRVELATPEMETIEEPLSLEVPALSQEVESMYTASTVKVYMEPHEGYGLVGSECTGTSVENGLVITAAHCLRRVWDADGQQEFGIFSKDGSDVRKSLYVGKPSKYSITVDLIEDEFFFPEYDDGYDTYDVEILRTSKQASPYLPLARNATKTGDAVYLFSRYGDDDSRVYGGRVLGNNSVLEHRVSLIFSAEDSNGVCIPGTSGTGVINQQGNVVGVNVSRTDPFVIDRDAQHRYQLSESELGKTAVVCNMVPTEFARQLLP